MYPKQQHPLCRLGCDFWALRGLLQEYKQRFYFHGKIFYQAGKVSTSFFSNHLRPIETIPSSVGKSIPSESINKTQLQTENCSMSEGETKSNNHQPNPCAKGLNESWACNYTQAVTLLRANFMAVLALEKDSKQKCDPDDSPAVCVLRIAFHLIFKALLTGDDEDVKPALVGLNNAQSIIDAQRSKYLNSVEELAESIPIVGGLMSFLWSPVQNATNSALDATGLRKDSAKHSERMVHAALGADALTQMFRSLVTILSGKMTEGLPLAHASYRSFLSIPSDTLSGYAKDARNFGIGFYTILLSYIPALYRVGFNAAAGSSGISTQEGLQLLQSCASQTDKQTISPMLSSMALIGVAFWQMMHSKKDGTSEEIATAKQVMANERARLEALNADPMTPNNVAIQWILVSLDSRKRNFRASAVQLTSIMTAVGPYIENKSFTTTRSSKFSLNGNSGPAVHRIRINLAIVFLVMSEWDKAFAVLEPCIMNGTGYVGRGVALVLAAGALAQLNPTDPLIDDLYAAIQNLSDYSNESGKKSGAGRMDISIKRKLKIDLKRADRRVSLYDSLFLMSYFGANMDTTNYMDQEEKDWIVSIHTHLQSIHQASLQRYEQNKNDVDASEEMAAILLLLGAVAYENCNGNYGDTVGEEHFLQCVAICEEHKFDNNYHLPYALSQLGIVYLRRKNYSQAKECLSRAKNIKKGYTFDSAILHRVIGPLEMCQAELAK